MTSSKHPSLVTIIEPFEIGVEITPSALENTDAEFGGHEARQRLERKLVRKVDLRMSILIVIYILNYVRLQTSVLLSARLRIATQMDRNNIG